MRIAQVMLDTSYGELQRNFLNHCTEFAKCGYPLLAVCRTKSYALSQLISHPSLDIVAIENRLGYFDSAAINQIAKSLNQFAPDIVGTYGSRAVFFCGKIRRKNKWSMFASVSNPVYVEYVKPVDTHSPSSAQMVQISYRKNRRRHRFTEVIPHFSPVEPVPEVTRKQKFRKLFSAGRLVSKNGFDVLLKAVAGLRNNGFDVELQIAGDGPLEAVLRELTGQLGIADVVAFLGRRDDVPSLMGQSDVFVLPSVVEPFGIVLLEAVAKGIPIVATRTTGPLSIFDANSAQLVEINDVESLSDGIANVVRDPATACDRAERALEFYRREYSAEVVVPKILALYERLIETRHG